MNEGSVIMTTRTSEVRNPATRGMVLVHHEHSSYWVNDEPGKGHSVESDDFTIGVVTSVTREGIVKRFRTAGWGTDRPGPADKQFRGKVYMAPGIDPEAALEAAKAHTWPGHPEQPMPFRSLEEVRAVLRPVREAEREAGELVSRSATRA